MHTLLTTIVLCLAAHVASAQCVSGTPPATAAAPAQRMELIKTAAAETRDASTIARLPQVATQDKAATTEHRRRTGPAMLLAALALMSGIALRRSSASGQ